MPSLEERRLVKLGRSSVVITLPLGWLRYYGLRPGDRVEILVDDEIVIRPVKGRGKDSRSAFDLE